MLLSTTLLNLNLIMSSMCLLSDSCSTTSLSPLNQSEQLQSNTEQVIIFNLSSEQLNQFNQLVQSVVEFNYKTTTPAIPSPTFTFTEQDNFTFVVSKSNFLKMRLPESTTVQTNTDSFLSQQTQSHQTDQNILVNCRSNFTAAEKRQVHQLGVRSLFDLLNSSAVSQHDKSHSKMCFKYVRRHFELTGEEPYNGNCIVCFDCRIFCVKIMADESIKFCKCLSLGV